ncbi:MAG: hypothetical protein CL825_04840 [Crocinitomicaceae bacterium]|nr:hypothetical protein [Crocinitomicaceae bacterium]
MIQFKHALRKHIIDENPINVNKLWTLIDKLWTEKWDGLREVWAMEDNKLRCLKSWIATTMIPDLGPIKL